ncbi:hypothetical protein GGR54DRAFT_109053 [Hypoxylon sp. NC1633]|nr:hypothetical protein GGR54DRAFT_109053 [Hypoxylon sp. NC1633]
MSTRRKSRKSDKTTAWSEWEWDEGRSQWGRYRMSRGEYEYEWRNPEPSSSSTSKPEEKKDRGKEEEKVKKKGKLSVALYRPRWGSLRHWALYLDVGNYVYEVTGEAMQSTAEAKAGIIPNNSGSWIESIPVAEIQAADMAELHRIITETPVQNDVQGWCCQDYVMALEGLNEEQIVDDEGFGIAKKRLMKRFNS